MNLKYGLENTCTRTGANVADNINSSDLSFEMKLNTVS